MASKQLQKIMAGGMKRTTTIDDVWNAQYRQWRKQRKAIPRQRQAMRPQRIKPIMKTKEKDTSGISQLLETIVIHAATADGWPVDFHIKPGAGNMDKVIAFLQKQKFGPAAGAVPKMQYTPDGLPICPKHQFVMKKREKQGDTWFSHVVEDAAGKQQYCRGHKSKYGPGYDL